MSAPLATEPVDAELKAGFQLELEAQMVVIQNHLEQLIQLHERYGDTLQHAYLCSAKRAIRDGLKWFEWSRSRRAKP